MEASMKLKGEVRADDQLVTQRGSPKIGKEKVRLSLDISAELNALLEQLAAATGGTKSDVLRKAIALMDLPSRFASPKGKRGILHGRSSGVTAAVTATASDSRQ